LVKDLHIVAEHVRLGKVLGQLQQEVDEGPLSTPSLRSTALRASSAACCALKQTLLHRLLSRRS
jgi:hypothetical protein